MDKIEQFRQYKFVIKELTSREIKRKYSRSYLGIMWSVLNPLLSMAVMSAIFTTIFRRSIANFPMYYLTGTILWSMFTGATNSAMTALVDNKTLLIKVKLPMQIFPLSRIYTALVNLGYSFVAYIVFLVIFKIRPSWTMICIIPTVFFLLLFATGIGMFLSIAYVFFGDIKHLYSVVLTLWMYCSAIFYPVDSLSGVMQKIVQENPVFSYIASARMCMIYGIWPQRGLWIRMIFWGVLSFSVGYFFFQKMKNKVMQKI